MGRVSDRISYTVLLAVGVVCILAFLLFRLPRAAGAGNTLISMDGPGYYSYLRSLVFDGDLDFRNEYSHFFGAPAATATGLPPNVWTIGPAFLWGPFYLAAHVLSLAAYAVGVHVNVDGYGYVYESAVCIATIVYVTAGCFLTYRICRTYFSPYSSLIAVLGVYLASSLIHYTVACPAVSHGVSFFAVSLFLFLWHPPRSRTYKEWALLGLSAGLMILVRPQNLLYLSVLAVEVVHSTATSSPPANRIRILEEYLRGAALVGIILLIVFAPQMLAWNTLYGRPITVPAGPNFFDWLHPDLLEYLFSTRPGFFTCHPIMLLATLGFVPLWRRDKKVTMALLTALLLQWYLNSAISESMEAFEYAFGARRMISATPLLMVGMAALTESVTKRLRRGSLVMLGAVTALVGWNFLFELQFSLGFISYGDPLTWNELVLGKFRMMVEFIGRVVPLR